MSRFDCRDCGACCCNTECNRRDGTQDYIEVEPGGSLRLGSRHALKQLAQRNEHGEWHMLLTGRKQRCVALVGDVGGGVRCAIYADRPRVCKNVEAGDEECLRARRFHGLTMARWSIDDG
jgi:Fe-S-cluster containining protein